MRNKIKIAIGICAIIFLIIPSTCSLPMPSENVTVPINDIASIGSSYKGFLRIYIAEIESRWDMYTGEPFEYAFYDYAFNEEIEIEYLNTYQNLVTWQGDIQEDNIIIIAAIFNEKSYRNYADPPMGRPFDAYYVDAAAGVRPGETESNVKNEAFTHTVFCEVGSQTTCVHCPDMADVLVSIYDANEYPFYFIEMVTDMSSQAANRMDEYNQKYSPTAFYSGGYELVIGGGADIFQHSEAIEQCGKQGVNDLDFILGSEWNGDGTVDITISITNNEELDNTPPDLPTMEGPESGKINQEYTYQIHTIDPDSDDVYYKVDWGDGTISDWLGPFTSGETTTATHSWNEEGSYIAKVKAKDVKGDETEWNWLRVTMPKAKGYHLLFERLFERFPLLEYVFF